MGTIANQQSRRNETRETPILAHLETRVRDIEGRHRKPLPALTVAHLTHIFGVGDHPLKRRAAYRKIAHACEIYGPAAQKIVRSAIARSRDKASPDRWFICVVLDELRRSDLLLVGE